MPTLHRLPPADWPDLAEFIHRCNQAPGGGVRCLHAAQGDDVASHAAELAGLPADEAAFWAIVEDGRQVGVVGCEVDAALKRAWLRGPLTVEPCVLDALLPLVGPTLEAALPAVQIYDAFPSADDAPLNAWYAAAGYTALQLHTVLRAPIVVAHDPATTVRRATPQDLPAMLSLHLALFPSPYIGEAEFHRALAPSADCALFVTVGNDGLPVGYLYVQDNASEHEAYVDYLGVLPSQRGQGRGRVLLDAAARWGAEHGRAHLALTVREDRRSALGLYQRWGFGTVSSGRHWRKTVDQAPAR